ncbi:copper resistance protein CopC [Streptomyces sp. DSM 41014]|uniref:Copper resistance protein CopC n=1 Tax=Streptomyces hintoniae TaxID=3075521 RepID=A0ABU2UT60_9ACTN|nr:copper resistance protein CopC [Streptomyces sp. DSM 41014]MDT0476477.1 copper resistance protein CopC [Streptomyces sp. DSM 41014]
MTLASVLVLLVLGGAGTASAHAALRSTDPGDGAVVATAPSRLTLTFTESVALLDDSFRVLDPENRRVDTGEAGHGPGGARTARVSLPPKLAQGTYVVVWRVVSADSHPVSGAFTFSVGKASPTLAVTTAGPTEDPATASLYDIGRYLAYLAAALLIGTAAFIALCRPADPAPLRAPLLIGWWTLLGSTLVLLVLRAPYETGTGPGTAFDPAALGRTLTGRPGIALLARLALLLTAAFCHARLREHADPARRVGGALGGREGPAGAADGPLGGRERLVRVVGGALAVGLALTWATAEHASAGIQVPVAMTSAVLHLLAMAVWLGGLTALLLSLYRAADLDPATVTRFSRLAFASVTVLVVTGVYQSWRGLGSWDALTGTTYGALLTAKLAAVVVLLTAAALSRSWTGRLAAAPDPDPAPESVPESAPSPLPHRRALRRSVLAEVAVAVVVLVISTVLSGTLPGRAAAEAAEGPATAGGLPVASVTTIPFDVGTPNGKGKVQITLDPGRVGDNAVQAVVYGPDGGLSTVPELRLSLTLPSQRIGPLDARIRDAGGYWTTSDLTVPLAGTWTMKVTVRVSELDQVSASARVRITG